MRKLLITLLATTVTIPAFAWEPYIGVQGGFVASDFSYKNATYVDFFHTGFSSITSYSSTGYNLGITGGYKFNKYFATELSYMYLGLGSLKLQSGPINSLSNISKASTDIYDAAFVVSYPILEDKIIPFAKLGAALAIGNGYFGKTQDGLLYGVGLGYQIMPHLATNINVQYMSVSSTGSAYDQSFLVTGAGVTYTF